MTAVLDTLIGYISPKWAMTRTAYRTAKEYLSRGFEAAKRSRRTANWYSNSNSVNADLRSAGATLRSRNRDTVMNNAFARKAMRAIPANVIGTGIRPAIRTGSQRRDLKVKKLWRQWADSMNADFDGNQTFYGLQRLAFRAMLESGECFIVRRLQDKTLQLQVLESDFLDSTRDGYRTDSGGWISQGVEFDANGRRVAYWLYYNHPGETHVNFKLESRRVPAADVIHLFYQERPGQIRGVPLGMASLLRLRDFADYQDAQLIRQKIAACFSVFVTSESHGLPISGTSETGLPLEKVEPGIIERLRPGEQVSFAAPPAVEGFDEYSRNVLREIAAGFDAPYEMITGDLSNVNFSSGRMGRMEFAKLVEEWQEQVMIPKVCAPIFNWWVQAEKIKQAIPANAEIEAEWTSPKPEFIDPMKEVKAMVEKVRGNLMSWQEAVRQLGYDPETVYMELIQDKDNFDKAGLMPYTDPRFDPGRVQETKANESNTDSKP